MNIAISTVVPHLLRLELDGVCVLGHLKVGFGMPAQETTASNVATNKAHPQACVVGTAWLLANGMGVHDAVSTDRTVGLLKTGITTQVEMVATVGGDGGLGSMGTTQTFEADNATLIG